MAACLDRAAMGWNDYQKQLKRHPRYQAPAALPVAAVPLRLWQRRALWLGLANLIPLLGAMALDWGLSGVLWVYWGEALGLTAWMVLKVGLQERWIAALASLAALGFYASQLVGLSAVEARTYQLLPAHHLAAGLAAILVGIAFLLPAHALPPIARHTSVWPQLLLVHGFIVAGGGLALLTKDTLGIAFVLAVSKAIGQVSLATHRELHNLERISLRAGASTATAGPRATAAGTGPRMTRPVAAPAPVKADAAPLRADTDAPPATFTPAAPPEERVQADKDVDGPGTPKTSEGAAANDGVSFQRAPKDQS